MKIGRLTRLRAEDVARIAREGLPEQGSGSQLARKASRGLQEPTSCAAQGSGLREESVVVREAPAKAP